MLHFFNRLKVGTKILVGYFVALVLMLMIGSITLVQLNKVNGTVVTLTDNLAQELHFTNELMNQILVVRLYTSRYVNSKNDADLKLYTAEIEKFYQLIKTANEKNLLKTRPRIEQVQKSVEQYQALLMQLVDVYKQRQQNIEQVILAQGVFIENELHQLVTENFKAQDINQIYQTSAIQQSWLSVRLNASKFLEKGDNAWIDKFEESHQAVQTEIATLKQTGNSPIIAEIEKAIQKYMESFNQIKAGYAYEVDATKQLRIYGADVRDNVENIINDITADFESAKQTAQATVQQTVISTGSTLLGAIIISLGFGFGITRSITRQLGGEPAEVASMAERIANGDLAFNSGKRREGLFGSMQLMQQQLRERIEEDKRIADEALRINQALDSVTTNVIIADSHFKIIYANKAVQTLFQREQDKFRQELPQLNTTNLCGQTIDSLHKDSQAHRRILQNLQRSEHSRLDLTSLVIEYIVTPVISPQGERVGYVKELQDRTVEVATEQEINNVIHAASQGDFEKRVGLAGKTGFFKSFSEGVNQIMNYNQLAVEDTMRMFAALAKGDLTQKIDRNYLGSLEQLKNDANSTVDKLTEIITFIKESADTVSTASEEISTGNISLSQRTEEQAASLEETAASMEEMTSTVQQNADNARQATQLASTARERAAQGRGVVGSAVQAMSAISESSRRVADIISVIDEIAFQTNLLALNAAVEAARAGEQGRGFAVVATEVRNLAQRSANAAKEIKNLIRDSVEKVKEGTQLVNESGNTLQEIVTAVKKVSDIIAEIAAASQEQSSGIHQVNKAISQMDEMTQQNAALVEESASASESMTEQAQRLRQQVAFFQTNRTIQRNSTQKTEPTKPKAVDKASHFLEKVQNKTEKYKKTPDTTGGEWEDF
ncbi:methyl-accepting chemotaxis protein [Beggiatoa leptomitoformis]|uniref:Chemotaxis protein n=1 Tax=Beggiatoa leptomitoformis TaxID=288004 RepID=A0A2N9YC47_9GAMM|nr:methyl-accepting chemotaxis protein [Beggiatoa leptomitoformis]AUI68016.1 chemotaxis protein [Beggiatoa leptomitoformis]QGX03468.1 chemotaxis protein [Beggiatoa leptomitoformis]